MLFATSATETPLSNSFSLPFRSTLIMILNPFLILWQNKKPRDPSPGSRGDTARFHPSSCVLKHTCVNTQLVFCLNAAATSAFSVNRSAAAQRWYFGFAFRGAFSRWQPLSFEKTWTRTSLSKPFSCPHTITVFLKCQHPEKSFSHKFANIYHHRQ